MVAMPRQVQLMPEDIGAQRVVANPVYGTVTTVVGPTATVRLDSPPHATVQVPVTTARVRQVGPSEYEEGAPGEWVRKAALGVCDGAYVVGQVVAYNGDQVTLRTLLGEFRSRVVDLVEVAPVLCFLTGKQQLRVDVRSAQELTAEHDGILDRLVGNDQRGSRSIPMLLSGCLPARQHPKPTDTLRWINVSSGAETLVSVRLAVDYVHYVDGNHRITASVRDSIGEQFDADPRYANVESESPVEAEDTHQDDLEALLSSPSGAATTPTPPSHQTVVNHTKILAAIADDPQLIRFYLGLCQQGALKRPALSANLRESAQRRRLESPSDLIDASEVSQRRSKHAFAPTRTQTLINGLTTAPDYTGKEPSAVVDLMISSRSTKLKPHPAIITRTYDFQFGARGLSIMHFSRFDFAA